MANNNNVTNKLQSVVNLASTHVDLMPLAGVAGYTEEPALSLCNDALSELLCSPLDWKFNRVEMPMLVTARNKQDYLFAGASAFTLGSTSTGAAIDLASDNAITSSGTTITVVTLEPHRFKPNDVVFMVGNTIAAFNSMFTDDGNSTFWSGGWTITSTPTANTFVFTHATSGLATSGAPGINNFGWLASASMLELNNTSSPPNTVQLDAVREIPVWSRVNSPEKVAVEVDYGTGIIKVRFYYVPGSTIWGVNLIYQAAAPLKSTLDDDWSPFPDSYSAVYRQAFLYRCYRYLNSTRTDSEYQKLQQQTSKFLGADDREASDYGISPAEAFLDNMF